MIYSSYPLLYIFASLYLLFMFGMEIIELYLGIDVWEAAKRRIRRKGVPQP